MSDVQESEKIRELKGEVNPGEIYSFSIYDGKVHISGSEEFASKARVYERLVNTSLNSSWNQLFHSGFVSEKNLVNTVDGILRFYMDEDYAIQRKDITDSIENHISDAFDKWEKTIQPESVHFLRMI